MFDFSDKTMIEIINIIKSKNLNNLKFKALNPDIKSGIYSGTKVEINGKEYIYRSLKNWINLAEIFKYRALLPKLIDKNFVEFEFVKLKDDSFHNSKDSKEKYGANSKFAKINKQEESAFLYYYLQSLDEVDIKSCQNILNLGINRGDEFLTIKEYLKDDFYQLKLTGIDYSKSAINQAKDILIDKNVNFYCHDINRLDELNLDKFDLIISIGTFQTTSVDTKAVIMNLIQNYLNKNGRVIFGFPNSRWIDGELIYGAKAPNYRYNELSLVIKDIYWIKKYLQQKKFRVSIVGKDYLFLRGVRTKV